MAKQSIAHVGGKGETAAQDAFAAMLAQAYAQNAHIKTVGGIN